MRKGIASVVIAAVALLTAVSAAAGAQGFGGLAPGDSPVELEESVDVNVVLIGFDGLVDPGTLQAHLPSRRVANLDSALGEVRIDYLYRYELVDTPAAFDDFFFGLLRLMAQPQAPAPVFDGLPPIPITPDQAAYDFCNIPPSVDPGYGCDSDPATPRVNPRTISQNFGIHAPSVELLLAFNLGFLGIDVMEPTVVLVNWWGRDDYVDHVYLNTDEPDHDTAFPRGLLFSNLLGGWGGTPPDDPQSCPVPVPCASHRVWFVDLSAGPFFNNGSWDLVSPDSRTRSVPNGIVDYRIHHPADYQLASGETYRELSTTLTSDLGHLVGDVFLGAIATPNPLFPPALSPPDLPDHIEIEVNRYERDDPRNLDLLIDLDHVTSRLSSLPYEVSAQTEDKSEQEVTLLESLVVDGEYGHRPTGEVGGFAHDHIQDLIDYDSEYEVPAIQIATPGVQQPIGRAFGIDTLRGFVHATTPNEPTFIGHSRVFAHEAGHVLGLSHPFNGYQCVDDECTERRLFGTDDSFFTWNGVFVHGVMTYAAVNDDFSTFERDNMNRFLGVSFLASISEVSDKVLRKPDWPKVESLLIEADHNAAQARLALAAGDYELGVALARESYRLVREAADILHVPVEPESNTSDIRTPPDPPTALLTDGLDVSGILSSAVHHPAIDSLVELSEESVSFENAPNRIWDEVPAYTDG